MHTFRYFNRKWILNINWRSVIRGCKTVALPPPLFFFTLVKRKWKSRKDFHGHIIWFRIYINIQGNTKKKSCDFFGGWVGKGGSQRCKFRSGSKVTWSTDKFQDGRLCWRPREHHRDLTRRARISKFVKKLNAEKESTGSLIFYRLHFCLCRRTACIYRSDTCVAHTLATRHLNLTKTQPHEHAIM